ncbi:histidine phosphatase family protein [Candidatus Woesebacteria bacterium]|nr:histidine phosphatase family protein [Candidatus Woesebacteria bacterium]MCD8506693.1 histidine phosphatase family protein [Candidatus Woesebacteria bacterium]MCD8527598.1 histidine phosphatase family protein [Candidatus Woesebacteria bacterium]MCD8546430.1 histidine phosphatase family protein [Candidatus Woesebacteria bacterium]
MSTTQIYLIRHAQSEGNALWDQGQVRLAKTELGSKLTDLGIEQANNLAKELQNVGFDVIYSSHLNRAHQTAQILKMDRILEVNKDAQLREREEGEEMDEDAIARFVERVKHIATVHTHQIIAVVTHGFVMRGFLAYLGYKQLEEMPQGFIKNTGYIVFEFENGNFRIAKTKQIG